MIVTLTPLPTPYPSISLSSPSPAPVQTETAVVPSTYFSIAAMVSNTVVENIRLWVTLLSSIGPAVPATYGAKSSSCCPAQNNNKLYNYFVSIYKKDLEKPFEKIKSL